jgi:hypothetical protein
MRLLITVSCAVLLAGCAGSPYSLARGNPAELAAASVDQLCFAYVFDRSPAVRVEIERRGLLSDFDWQHAPQGAVAIGMTATGVRCALGMPSAINRTATRAGVQEQWVYARGARRSYVYIEAGVVTAWQG